MALFIKSSEFDSIISIAPFMAESQSFNLDACFEKSKMMMMNKWNSLIIDSLCTNQWPLLRAKRNRLYSQICTEISTQPILVKLGHVLAADVKVLWI